MYICLLFSLPLYIYILINQSITFINKAKILLYSISMSLITYFGLKGLQELTFVFWEILYKNNYLFFLLYAAILEEFTKFFLIPFISKDIFTIDKMCVMTALNFSLLETIGYFYITKDYLVLFFRICAITPLHLFIAFLYYYIFYKIQITKKTKLLYFIPCITALFHTFLNYIISFVPRYVVLGLAILSIVFMIYIIKKYMFRENNINNVRQ